MEKLNTTKKCNICEEEKSLKEFHKKSSGKFGRAAYCKTCAIQKDREKYLKRIEQVKVYTKEYYWKNREELLYKNKEYREKNKEELYSKHKKYWAENKHRLLPLYRQRFEENRDVRVPIKRAASAKYEYDKRRACPPWSNLDKIKEIYKERYNITKETGIIYHVDHIIPLKGKTVCGLHVPENLRIIPANENLSKHNNLIEEIL